MPMTFTEGQHKAGWLKHELEGYMSRGLYTVLSGQVLVTGTLIGRTTAGGAATATAQAGNTGDGAMGAITVTGPARVGRHRLEVTGTGATAAFQVFDPDGNIAGVGAVASAYSSGGLAFTLADGSADYIPGDTIFIDVTGTEKVKVCDPTATDGAAVCRGIILDSIDATGADHAGAVVIERNAVVNEALASTAAPALAQGWQGTITFGAGFTTAAQKAAARAQLLALGILVRN